MRTAILASFGALLAAASLVLAGSARADDNSYLAELDGVPMAFPHNQLVTAGHMICSLIHDGMSPQDVMGQFKWSAPGPVVVTAAQRNLCPDTLGR